MSTAFIDNWEIFHFSHLNIWYNHRLLTRFHFPKFFISDAIINNWHIFHFPHFICLMQSYVIDTFSIFLDIYMSDAMMNVLLFHTGGFTFSYNLSIQVFYQSDYTPCPSHHRSPQFSNTLSFWTAHQYL